MEDVACKKIQHADITAGYVITDLTRLRDDFNTDINFYRLLAFGR